MKMRLELSWEKEGQRFHGRYEMTNRNIFAKLLDILRLESKTSRANFILRVENESKRDENGEWSYSKVLAVRKNPEELKGIWIYSQTGEARKIERIEFHLAHAISYLEIANITDARIFVS